jgi:hypothetical protein
MNLLNIIGEIEKTDPEVVDKMNSRRSALKSFRNIGQKLALATVPVALGSLLKKSYAGTRGTNDVLEILNYALTLEYLEAEFYSMALMSPGLIPGGTASQSIQMIAKHEMAHVNFLKSAITGAGGTPVDKPTFDFSAGNGSGDGPLKTVFSDVSVFLNVAQTFEDTGVRAYKGRAGELAGTGDVLTAALKIHSVEARHAAYIRYLRRMLGSGFGNLKPWITGNASNIDAALVQPSYDGEQNTNQAGIEIVNINGLSISADAASEAFDEPLTKEQVLAIVDPFIV